jgi:hypothetical protein
MVADFLEEEAMAHTKLVIGTTNRRSPRLAHTSFAAPATSWLAAAET